MRKISYISFFVFMLIMCGAFVSCSKDDDEGSSGLTISLTSDDYKPYTSDEGNVEYGYFDGVMCYRVTSEENKTLEVAKGVKEATQANIPQDVTIDGIKHKVTSIGKGAFSNCTSLISLTIPGSIVSIGNYAFQGCSGLKRVELKSPNPPAIGEYAFYGTNCPIYVPTDSKEVYKTEWKEWANQIRDVASTNPQRREETVYVKDSSYYRRLYWDSPHRGWTESVVSDGSLFYRLYKSSSYMSDNPVEMTAWVCWVDKYAENISIPKYVIYKDEKYVVNGIDIYAFGINKCLKSVSIPVGFTCINSHAFYGCESLESVTIPESVVKIEDYAFENCLSLKNVSIPNGVTEIQGGAFFNCKSLETVTIPINVTSIGSGAFYDCGLLDIYMKCPNPPKMYSRSYYGASFSFSASFSTQTFNNATLHVPAGLKGKYAYDENWGSFVHIVDDL
ncbi:MAG: leucine-rich repeat domain-containing protein [Bacteroidaceae bacterium]|nr:leucine-rich repeat domain-containing protein [Bacteroidaceae bacterium]